MLTFKEEASANHEPSSHTQIVRHLIYFILACLLASSLLKLLVPEISREFTKNLDIHPSHVLFVHPIIDQKSQPNKDN